MEVPTFDTPVATEHLSAVAGLPVVWLVDESGAVVKTLVQPELDDLSAAPDELLPTAN